jgi:glucose/arabinose dehydrogenase
VRRVLICLSLAACAVGLTPGQAAATLELPSGFHDSIVLSEIPEPTIMRFSPDGRVFVATKSGQILVYDDLNDTSPEVFADLRTEVYDNGDRGLLGLALDPDFEGDHYVYALYTYDHILGGQGPEGAVPRWGTPSASGDPCPKPGDADVDACPVSGRLVRLTAEGNHAQPSSGAPQEKVLLEDWCQQFSSHSIGDLQFGPEGALYASGGDGASFNNADYGQFGWPQKNMCGDPPGAVGQALSPPGAEGGALRSQDLRTPADPTTLDGSVVRIDPETGAAWPGNPLSASSDPNARRIVGYGFRNPFRFTIDPAGGEIYVGNVGWDTYEEIDRVPAVGGLPVFNSGWPCYEGPGSNPIYAGLGIGLCQSLYAEPASVTPPFFYYRHYENVAPEENCNSGTGSALAGLAFYPGGPYPDAYDGALFFADPVRGCIWVMHPGDDGRPDPLSTTTFMAAGGLYPGVDLEVGPERDLYYVKLFGGTGEGTIHRISYDQEAPVARLTADKQWGPRPLQVHFDASASTDPGGKPLNFEWDFDGDGTFEDEGDSEEVANYDVSHNVSVGVRVSNGTRSNVARVTLFPDDSPPQPQIEAPTEALVWRVGQQVGFLGSADDPEEGDLPDADLYWKTRLYHCPSECHAHPLQVFPGVSGGSFVAPDHDYPSHIEISLTATDARGLTATKSVSIDPHPVQLELESDPAGIQLSAGETSDAAPFPLTVIEGANVLLSAPAMAEIEGVTYTWKEWSDGGARAHSVKANTASTYTAVYEEESSGEEPGGEEPGEGGEEPGEGGGGEQPQGGVGDGPSGGGQSPPTPIPGPPSVAPPPISTKLSRHPDKRTRRDVARFVFSASVAGARFLCKLDDREFGPCSSPRIYRNLGNGPHTFAVTAIGASGTPEPLLSRYAWRVLCPPLGPPDVAAIPPRRGCARPAGSASRRGR